MPKYLLLLVAMNCALLPASDYCTQHAPVEIEAIGEPYTRFARLGEVSLLILRFKFVGDDKEVGTMDTAELAALYEHASYGRRTLVISQSPLITVPHSRQDYLDNAVGEEYVDTLERLARDDYGIDVDDFDYVMEMCRTGKPFLAKAGGLAGLGGSRSQVTGTNMRVAAHELGHNHGLRHANRWEPDDSSQTIGPGDDPEYGNRVAIMGRGSRDFCAAHKYIVHWLDDPDIHTVTTSGIYTIRAYDLGVLAADARYAILIKQDADITANQYFPSVYFLSFRQNCKWESMNHGLTMEAYKHPSFQTRLLDATPSDERNFQDASLLVGHTYADPTNGIYFTPLRLDGSGTDAELTVRVDLGDFSTNHPPTAALSAPTTTVPPGSELVISCQASDEDGDDLVYRWTDQTYPTRSDQSERGFSWSTNGEHTIDCVVSDGRGGETTASLTITVTDDPGNQAPTIDSIGIADEPVTATTTSATVVASDPDDDVLTVLWSVDEQPADATAPAFDDNEDKTPTITFFQAGDYRFRVTVSDGVLSTSATVDCSVAQTATNLTVTP